MAEVRAHSNKLETVALRELYYGDTFRLGRRDYMFIKPPYRAPTVNLSALNLQSGQVSFFLSRTSVQKTKAVIETWPKV